MITLESQRHWLQQLLLQGQETNLADQPGWLQHARDQANQAVTNLPLLDRKQEAWRYTSIENLLKQPFQPSTTALVPRHGLSEQDIEKHLGVELNAYRIVMVNGHYVPHLSDIKGLPSGVTLNSLRHVLAADAGQLAAWFEKTAQHTENVFTALNTALINDGVFLHIASQVELDRPIEVVYLAANEQQALLLQPRNLIVLDEGAKATVVERFVSDKDTQYFHNQLCDIIVGQHASLNHYRIQNESAEAYHLSNLFLSQHTGSHYHGVTLSFGGAWNRTEYHTLFKQEHAECELNGLSVVGDQQLSDFHLKVHHSAAGCVSRERFKAVLYGKGRAVFDGHILVDKQAQKSDAELSNDNLMLTRDAEVDTKPQLEIYADDVKCSHGTTVGELDPQQIFYLRSRGLDAATARRMLCIGFANDVIDSIPLAALRDDAMRLLNDDLTAALTIAG